MQLSAEHLMAFQPGIIESHEWGALLKDPISIHGKAIVRWTLRVGGKKL